MKANLESLRQSFKNLPYTIHYAAKANSLPGILTWFQKEGVCLDIVSGGELFLGLHSGFQAKDMVFSGVGKTNSEIHFALNAVGAPLKAFHIESLSELKRMIQICRDTNKTAPISFRFNPNISVKTHPYISTGLKKNKFGLDQSELKEAVDFACKNQKFVTVTGLSIHIGSQLLDSAPLLAAYKKARETAEWLEKQIGHPLSHLDLGGGFGIDYKTGRTLNLNQLAQGTQKIMGDFLRARPNLSLIFEPGRYLMASAGKLLSKIVAVKVRGKQTFLVLDAGMNNLIRPALYNAYHPILDFKKSREKTKYQVVGPVCESADSFSENSKLSKGLKEDDLICIDYAGAYGSSMASHYNSRPHCGEYFVRTTGVIETLRYPETWPDLVR